MVAANSLRETQPPQERAQVIKPDVRIGTPLKHPA